MDDEVAMTAMVTVLKTMTRRKSGEEGGGETVEGGEEKGETMG